MTRTGCRGVLAEIEDYCGYATVLDLPLLNEYFIDLGFDLKWTELNPRLHKTLIEAISEGLPLVKRNPMRRLPQRLNCSEADGHRWHQGNHRARRSEALWHRGAPSQTGLPRQRHGGLGRPRQPCHRVGHCIGQYSFVTLCYQRPRRLPEWRYNLFSMIHGQDREAVVDQVAFIVKQCGLQGIEHEILFSNAASNNAARATCAIRNYSNPGWPSMNELETPVHQSLPG